MPQRFPRAIPMVMSDEFARRTPIVPHEAVAVDCSGCLVAQRGTPLQRVRAVVGVIQADILKGLLGLERATEKGAHYGKANTFPGFTQVTAHVCNELRKSARNWGRTGTHRP
ncbi:MAG: hypothetical protein ABI759_25635 [Candidatus Solibacter sp.]